MLAGADLVTQMSNETSASVIAHRLLLGYETIRPWVRRPSWRMSWQIKREIVLEADAQTLERMRKEGHARGFNGFLR